MTDMQLRQLTEEDLPHWVEWLNDSEVTEFTDLEVGVTLEGERAWYASLTSPECREKNWQIDVAGRHIGGCSLFPDKTAQQAEFGVIIGDKTAWNHGHGTRVLQEVLRRGFDEMHLHRIHLRVFAENVRGRRCYEKCGFRREGYHVQAHYKRGRWIDVLSMAILKEEWERKEGGVIRKEGL